MLCKLCNTEKLDDDFYKSNKARCRDCIKASVQPKHVLDRMANVA